MKRFGSLFLAALLLAAMVLPAFGSGSLLTVTAQASDYSDGGGTGIGVVVCFILALIIAFVVIGILKGQLKSVAAKTEADSYAGPDALTLTHQDDVYTHTTRERVYSPLEKDED